MKIIAHIQNFENQCIIVYTALSLDSDPTWISVFTYIQKFTNVTIMQMLNTRSIKE
jgi:hypothetical protein